MSIPMAGTMALQRIEVITGATGRRRYTREQKFLLVEETLAPDTSVVEVARRADVDPSLLYRWRRQMLGAQPRLPAFTPVTVTPDDPISPLPPRPEPGVIDVEIAGGTRVRVTGAPQPATIAAVLAALTRRQT
jgi:transposase